MCFILKVRFFSRLRFSTLLFCIGLFISSASAQTKPNILLIISDDLNTNIGPYMGIEEHTPNLSQLAKEGIQFTRAYSQYPVCAPSRASLMSGLYPETNGVLGNQMVKGSYRGKTPSLANHPSMAGFFREQGYFSARVSKIFHMGVPGGIELGEAGDDDPDSWDYAYNVLGPETQSPGNLELLSPGNLHYGSNFARMILENGQEVTQTDYIATSQAIAILQSRAGKVAENATNKVKQKPNAPFFLAVGLVRPHVPLIAPQNCYEHYKDQEMEIPKVTIGENVPKEALRMQNQNIWEMDDEQKRKTIAAYMASVRFMDQQVGRLLDALDQLELRRNTIVVFISDHGYNLGEHDCWSKLSLWEGSIRVPMIISYPYNKNSWGTSTGTITELLDLYPTLADLAGFENEKSEILQGKSFADFISKDQSLAGTHFAYTVTRGGQAASVRSDRWRYNRWGDKSNVLNEELYDHQNDPEELVNLVDNSQYQETLKELRSKLQSYKETAKND